MVNFGDVAGMAGPAALKMVDDIGATLEPGDPINIQFTSGTTGAPKGATLTHRNIVNNARFTTDAMRFTAADRLCIPVPLYHCFGMVMGTLGCVTKGAAMIFPGEGFEPGRHAEGAERREMHRPSTACRPCSSPCCPIPISRRRTCRPCAPASWPARPARSRP